MVAEADWSIKTDADRRAVIDQMDRMLASPVFRGSKRLSAFLRFVVMETLANGGCDLNERLIGVQVFHRPPDYDTSGEPVVRVSTGELRKRIARYYHETGHDGELRIDLPTGTYRPIFRLPSAAVAALSLPSPVTRDFAFNAAAAGIEPAFKEEPVPSVGKKRRPLKLYAVTVTLGVLGAIAVTAAIGFPGKANERFWGPVVESRGPVLIYVGERSDDSRLVFEDALALTDLGGTMRARNRSYRILKAQDLTPEALKRGPTLLIGGFTNPIARRLTRQLRFTFATEGEPGSGRTERIFRIVRIWRGGTGRFPRIRVARL